MELYAQLVVNGITNGAVYGLLAAGFVLVYRASRALNFAQAAFNSKLYDFPAFPSTAPQLDTWLANDPFSFFRNSALNCSRARAMPSFTASACPATPPPETLASTVKLLAVSLEMRGWRALERCDSVTKY